MSSASGATRANVSLSVVHRNQREGKIENENKEGKEREKGKRDD